MTLLCTGRDQKIMMGDDGTRGDLVERARAEIAAGGYETPQRLEITIDRLMEELLAEPERLASTASGAAGR